MKKKEHISYLMDGTGCLTEEALRLYISGNAGREEADLMNGHIKDCALCRDALEGYASYGDPVQFSKDVHILKEQIRMRIPVQNKTVYLVNRRRYALFAAAASILLLAGLFSVILFYPELRRNLSANRLADNLKGVTDSLNRDTVLVIKQPAVPDQKNVHGSSKKPVTRILAKTENEMKPVSMKGEMLPDEPVEVKAAAPTEVMADSVVEVKLNQGDGNKPVAGVEISASSDSKSLAESVPMTKKSVSGNSRKMALQTSVNAEEDNQDVFFIVEKMPTFRGKGIDEFEKYISSHLKYPPEAKIKGIEGIVPVSFIVDTKGRITSVKIIRSVDPLLDAEALRVVKSSPEWKPGIQNGKEVKVQLSVSVRFRSE